MLQIELLISDGYTNRLDGDNLTAVNSFWRTEQVPEAAESCKIIVMSTCVPVARYDSRIRRASLGLLKQMHRDVFAMHEGWTFVKNVFSLSKNAVPRLRV